MAAARRRLSGPGASGLQLGVFGNAERPVAVQAAKRVLAWAARRSVSTGVEMALAQALDRADRGIDSAALARRCRRAVVIGGDGTLLRVAQLGIVRPVLAVNAGHLGFVTAVRADRVVAALEAMRAGRTRVASRMRLRGELWRGGRRHHSFFALNDAVLHAAALARLIGLRVEVDGESLAEFRADGVIVATPTGSTAYSMACGGPVVVPTVGALLVTPICAHPLSLRPLVVDPSSRIRVLVTERRQQTMLTVDGQLGFDLTGADEVRLERDPRPFRLVEMRGGSFLGVLRGKLRL